MDEVEALFAALLRESHLVEPDSLPSLAARALAVLGGRDVVMKLIDPEQNLLVPTGDGGEVTGEPHPVDTTFPGRCFSTGELLEAPVDGAFRIWLPLVDGADRLGVLGFSADAVDADLRYRAMAVGSLITQFLVSKGQYTDAYQVAPRRAEMSLAAEMQWRILPPLTLTTRRVAISGILEPAYDIGGDAFDYAVNGDMAEFAIVDAMGHGLDAAWPATVAIGSFRHSRRRGLDVAEAYRAATLAVETHFGGEIFVTAQFGQLDLRTGRLAWVNAGHPPPVLVRHAKPVGPLSLEPSLPLGLGELDARVGEFSLQPEDRLVFFTDGVVEGRGRAGEPFGEERLADVLGRETLAGHGPAETMRRVAHAVLSHHAHALEDDFTFLFLEYRGPDLDVEDAPLTTRREGDTSA